MIRTSQRVSIRSPSTVAWVGNQSMSEAEQPRRSPTRSPDRHQLLKWLRPSGVLVTCSLPISSPDPWTRQVTEVPRRREPIRVRAGGQRAASARACAAAPAGAERGRRDAVVAPERLRELGGLRVAPTRSATSRTVAAVRAASSSAARSIRTAEVLAERGVADLGVGTLELAPRRGRHAPGDVVEREVARVLPARRSRSRRRAGSRAARALAGTLWSALDVVRTRRRCGCPGSTISAAAAADRGGASSRASVGLCDVAFNSREGDGKMHVRRA
jgi:hypothetical protein